MNHLYKKARNSKSSVLFVELGKKQQGNEANDNSLPFVKKKGKY